MLYIILFIIFILIITKPGRKILSFIVELFCMVIKGIFEASANITAENNLKDYEDAGIRLYPYRDLRSIIDNKFMYHHKLDDDFECPYRGNIYLVALSDEDDPDQHYLAIDIFDVDFLYKIIDDLKKVCKKSEKNLIFHYTSFEGNDEYEIKNKNYNPDDEESGQYKTVDSKRILYDICIIMRSKYNSKSIKEFIYKELKKHDIDDKENINNL